MDVALRILKRTNDMIAVAMIQGYDVSITLYIECRDWYGMKHVQ